MSTKETKYLKFECDCCGLSATIKQSPDNNIIYPEGWKKAGWSYFNSKDKSIHFCSDCLDKYKGWIGYLESNTKIVHKMNGCCGLYLPHPETCKSATTKCKKMCVAQKLEDIGIGPTATEKKFTWEWFNGYNVNDYCFDRGKVLITKVKEATEPNLPILHWFASGDCKDNSVFYGYMKRLAENGIINCGFTRNSFLALDAWRDEYKYATIVLTVEKPQDALNLLSAEGLKKDDSPFLFAVPDYKSNDCTVHIYKMIGSDFSEKHYYPSAGCTSGMEWFAAKSLEPKLSRTLKRPNCLSCYQKKRGCFCLQK